MPRRLVPSILRDRAASRTYRVVDFTLSLKFECCRQMRNMQLVEEHLDLCEGFLNPIFCISAREVGLDNAELHVARIYRIAFRARSFRGYYSFEDRDPAERPSNLVAARRHGSKDATGSLGLFPSYKD